VVDGLICTANGVSLNPGFNALPCDVTDTVCFGDGDRSKLGDNCKILASDPTVESKPCDYHQVGAKLVGLATRLSYVCRSCACNAARALCHRHGVKPPTPTKEFGSFARFLERVQNEVRSIYIGHYAYWSEAWLLKWPKSKRDGIERSQDEDKPQPGRVKAMVKREGGHDMPSRPRLIQYYCNLATQALFGVEFFALQKSYTELFRRREVAPGIRVTFASCMNADDLGQWMTDVLRDIPNAMFYERDGKNWDSTMQRMHHDLKLLAYKPAGERLAAFVEAGFAVKGKAARGALKYSLIGTTKSGHNDTTLGNSLNNAAIAAESMEALGLSGDVIVAGDDLLAVVAGDFDERALSAEEAKYGIVPECRKFASARDVSFVSGIWLDAGDTWRFMPKPGRLVARLFWTTHPPPPRKVDAYRNGIVLGLRATCGGLPVLGAFLDAHYTVGVKADVAHDKRALSFTWACSEDIAKLDVMRSFCDRYDLDPSAIADCELFLTRCAGKVGLISHPVLDRLMEVDLADIHARPLSR